MKDKTDSARAQRKPFWRRLRKSNETPSAPTPVPTLAPAAPVAMTGFNGLGIAPGLLAAVDRLRFTEPTPIQRQSIPVSIEGKDIIAIAQTGTGKTLAFGLPMIQRLAQLKGRGLVITPTRELALQVDEMITAVSQSVGFHTAVLIGGASMTLQRRALDRKPRIIIATPGRLIDHLDHRTLRLADIEILVLDEADRMLDMGFAPQINKILAAVPKSRQMMLFSATMPPEILTLAKREMRLPIHVEVAPSGTTAEKVQQEIFFVEKGAKTQLLEVLLGRHRGPVLVFTRTKHGARKLTRQVKGMGHAAAEIHSNRTLLQRRDALDGFKAGKYRVLVATDIAARGIDVSGIELVVNYDLPTNTEDYVHRIGRTGRAGLAGLAVSFATMAQTKDVKSIERLVRTDLRVVPLPALPPQRKTPSAAPERPASRSGAGSPRPARRQRPAAKSSNRPPRKTTRTGSPTVPSREWGRRRKKT